MSRWIAVGLLLAWTLPSVCWGEPAVVDPRGGSTEQKAKAKQSLDEAVAAAKAAKKRVEECVETLEDVERAIEYEQSNNSAMRKAKSEYKAAEAAYRAAGFDKAASAASGLADSGLDKSVAKARMAIALDKYNKLRDELLKNDPRWVDATKPLSAVLAEQRDANTALERRRIECLVLVGRISGMYQPPPQDPRTAERLMLIMALQAKQGLRPGVRPSMNSQQRTQPPAPQTPQKPSPYNPNYNY
ncbi:MAG: hypothetical protein K8T91_23860 [Planctomycetes bacterium]|nr:hypothetical protein [Planctomycetota bacterium]